MQQCATLYPSIRFTSHAQIRCKQRGLHETLISNVNTSIDASMTRITSNWAGQFPVTMPGQFLMAINTDCHPNVKHKHFCLQFYHLIN